MFAILNNQVLLFRAAFLASTILALLIGFDEAQAQYDVTIEEIRVGSAWAAKSNRVIQEFGEVINSTTQLDEISEGVLSGEIKSDFASRQFKNTLASILIRFNNAHDAIKKLGAPPTFRDERLQRRMSGAFEILGFAEKSANRMIKESSLLFVAVKKGNKGATNKLRKKSITTFSSALGLQNEMLSGQMATFSSDEPNYYHYKGMFETYSALISGLNAILPIFQSGSVDIEMVNSGHLNLKISKKTYIIGRRIIKNTINKVSATKAPSPKDKNNKQILLKALHSMYESFDIEDEINIIVEIFLNQIGGDMHTFNPEYMDSISIDGNILENKRAKIMIYRQELLSGIK